eukprot:312037_1
MSKKRKRTDIIIDDIQSVTKKRKLNDNTIQKGPCIINNMYDSSDESTDYDMPGDEHPNDAKSDVIFEKVIVENIDTSSNMDSILINEDKKQNKGNKHNLNTKEDNKYSDYKLNDKQLSVSLDFNLLQLISTEYRGNEWLWILRFRHELNVHKSIAFTVKSMNLGAEQTIISTFQIQKNDIVNTIEIP